MKRLEKVYSYSYGDTLEVKIFRVKALVRRFEVEANDKVVFRTDSEAKARILADGFIEGYKLARA